MEKIKKIICNGWFQLGITAGIFIGSLFSTGVGMAILFPYVTLVFWLMHKGGYDLTPKK